MSNLLQETFQKVQLIEISQDQAGQRIDNFLFCLLKSVPKSRIYRLLRKGEFRINKKRIQAQYRLQENDTLRIPPIKISEKTNNAEPKLFMLDLINNSVIYEDKYVIVINKPSGIAVHGGSGITHGVIECMRQLRDDLHYLELVHRLDRETSGCLLIAKKRSALRSLHEQFREGLIHKQYAAVLKGEWQGGKRKIDAPLLKNTLKSGERVVKVHESGKPAQSLFKPVQILSNASLMDVTLLTGRTHQIRVHAAYSGHPIVGDDKYGDKLVNKQMQGKGATRLMLHAQNLSFSLPDAEQRITTSAPIPEEMSSLIRSLNS